MNKQKFVSVLMVFVALIGAVSPVMAIEEAYSLVFRREFGVGMPGAVQGHMSMTVRGDLDAVDKVVYLIDDQEMATMTAPSLKFQFNTDDYPAGEHMLYALITTKGGETIKTASFSVSFIEAGKANAITRKVLIGIGAILLFTILLSVLITKRQVEESKTEGLNMVGLWGATVCPKCGRAFNRNVFGLNLISKRYEPCPHCGKWSMTRRATKEEIEEANQKLKAKIAEDLPKTTPSYLRDIECDHIEESKYTEL